MAPVPDLHAIRDERALIYAIRPRVLVNNMFT